jgi:hypothetical protein
MQTKSIAEIVRRIEQGGTIALQGVEELAQARAVLQRAVQRAGYSLAFDPDSAPDLLDYLTVSGASGINVAISGASLGVLAGLIVGRAGDLAALGFALGLLVGISKGVDRVERGWRVRAIRGPDGEPTVTIRSLEPGLL